MERRLTPCMKFAACLNLLLCFLPACLSADVSITEQGTRRGSVPKAAWTRTLRIKGLKMRVDYDLGSGGDVYIYDLEAGKRYRLDAQKKEAFILDLPAESERSKVSLMFQSLRKVIKSTGKKLEVGGLACDEYTFDLQVPVRSLPQGLGMILHDHGRVCVSQVIPSGVEFASFVHEIRKRGYLPAVSTCSPSDSPIGTFFYGDQPNVLVLSVKSESVFEVDPQIAIGVTSWVEFTKALVAVNSDPIPDEIFQIPADWKVKNEPNYK